MGSNENASGKLNERSGASKYHEFYYNLFVARTIPDAFESVSYNGKEISGKTFSRVRMSPTALVTKCPEYLEYIPATRPSKSYRKIFRVKGYAMDLTSADTADSFLQQHFKSSFRNSLRRRLRGLDTCLDLRHEVFFGDLEQERYAFLMEALETMLTRRFDQRNEEHMALSDWSYFKSRTLELVRKKQASISVLYDEDRPIQICLNYHVDSIVFLAIPAYDIDYAKFGLGITGIYKVLEWSIENGFTLLDMGFGALDYKLRWCNSSYDISHYVFYKENSLSSRLFALRHVITTRVLVFLLDKKVNLAWRRIRNLWRKKQPPPLPDYSAVPIKEQETSTSALRQVNPFDDPSRAFLRNALLDFAYGERIPRSEIRVWEVEKGSYYLLDSGKSRVAIRY